MKDIGDVAAGGMVVGTWTSVLPDIAAALAIIWTLLRIYDWVQEKRGKGKPVLSLDPPTKLKD